MDTSPIVVDIECAPLPNVAYFLEPVTPDARLKDPAKIKEDIEAKTASRDGKTALDWNVGRIVALGWWTAQNVEVETSVCPSDEDEVGAIETFWKAARRRTIVTFNGRGFDLPYLIQRSRYLGIAHPTLDLRPYGGGQGNVDLYLELTFSKKDTPCMRTTLTAFCRRFGIPVTDDISGKEIPALVAAGELEKVAAHCSADVLLTVALARRLGVIQPAPIEAVI